MVRLFWVIGIIRAFEGVEVIKPFVIQNGQSGFLLVKGECIFTTNSPYSHTVKKQCKETGQYRKGEPASKPQNTKEFKSILGLQKCPVCPFCVNVVS